MFLSENLQEKWQPILEHSDLPKIEDNYKRAVTAVILENQEKALFEEGQTLDEAAPLNATGSSAVSNWNPILISLVRRAMPNLVAYDICGVQPMTGPTGLIFAMKARYNDYPSAGREGKTEALFNEADTKYSNDNQVVADGPLAARNNDPFNGSYATDTGAVCQQQVQKHLETLKHQTVSLKWHSALRKQP